MISVKADYDEIKGRISELSDPRIIKKFGRNMLRAAAREGARVAKKSLNSTAKKSTGSLYKSLKGSLSRKDRAVAVIGPSGSFNFMKAWQLEHGGTRSAKNGKYMTFQVKGLWVKKKSVTQPAKPWFAGPVGSYLESPRLGQEMDKQFQKDLSKLMEGKK